MTISMTLLRRFFHSGTIVSALVLILASARSAFAQKILTVEADAHVTDNVTDHLPNLYNFGGTSYLLIQNDPIRAYKAYLRFDLTPLIGQGTGTAPVQPVTLRLHFSRFRDQVSNTTSLAIEADTISVFAITDNKDRWTEGTFNGENTNAAINFMNAPHNDLASPNSLTEAGKENGAAVRFVGSFSVSRGTPSGTAITVDVTPAINWALHGGLYGFAPGGGTNHQITFVLTHTAGNDNVPNNGVQFFSKENTAGPGKQPDPAMAPQLVCGISDASLPAARTSTASSETSVARKIPLPEAKGLVTTIVDARTLLVTGVGNVTLFGVSLVKDTNRKPLPDDDLFGDEADRTMRRLAAGRQVRLEFEGEAKGSSPAWVFLDDGTLLNEELIRRGYARMDRAARGARYASRLFEAETNARIAKAGLWANKPQR